MAHYSLNTTSHDNSPTHDCYEHILQMEVYQSPLSDLAIERVHRKFDKLLQQHDTDQATPPPITTPTGRRLHFPHHQTGARTSWTSVPNTNAIKQKIRKLFGTPTVRLPRLVIPDDKVLLIPDTVTSTGTARTLLRSLGQHRSYHILSLLCLIALFPTTTRCMPIPPPVPVAEPTPAPALEWPAFDCSHPATTATELDATDTGECIADQADYKDPTTEHVTILKRIQTSSHTAYRCQVRATRTITRCGYDSLTYTSTNVELYRMVDLDPAACQTAATSGILVVENTAISVRTGVTTHHRFLQYGDTDAKGNCKVQSFIYRGTLYEKSYMETTFHITVEEVTGALSDNRSSILLDGTISCPYTDGHCHDDIRGSYDWTVTTSSCSDQFLTVFKGPVQISYPTNPNLTHTIVTVTNEESAQTIGLIVKTETQVCGILGYKTQISDVLIVMGKNGHPEDGIDANTVLDDLHTDHLKGLVGFLYVTIGETIKASVAQLGAALCALERKHLMATIAQFKTLGPTAFPRALGLVGHLAIDGGAVVYLLKCKSVTATYRPYPHPTLEIPVFVDGDPVFYDTVSQMILPNGTSVAPTSTYPIKWRVQNLWFYQGQNLMEAPPPQKFTLSKNDPPRFNYRHLNGGLYTTLTRKSVRANINRQVIRDARLKDFADTVDRGDTASFDLTTLFSADAAQSFLASHLPWYLTIPMKLGQIGLWAIGMLIALRIAFAIASMALRYFQLRQTERLLVAIAASCLQPVYELILPRNIISTLTLPASKPADEPPAHTTGPCQQCRRYNYDLHHADLGPPPPSQPTRPPPP